MASTFLISRCTGRKKPGEIEYRDDAQHGPEASAIAALRYPRNKTDRRHSARRELLICPMESPWRPIGVALYLTVADSRLPSATGSHSIGPGRTETTLKPPIPTFCSCGLSATHALGRANLPLPVRRPRGGLLEQLYRALDLRSRVAYGFGPMTTPPEKVRVAIVCASGFLGTAVAERLCIARMLNSSRGIRAPLCSSFIFGVTGTSTCNV